QNEEVDASLLKEPDLLRQQIASIVSDRRALSLKELSPRHRTRHESLFSGNFASNADRGLIDSFGLCAVSRASQFFPGAKECQSLENLRARAKEFSMQPLQSIRMLDGDFRSELTTASARSYLLPF